MSLTTLRGLRDTRAWFSNTTNLQRTLDTLQVLTAEFTQSAYGNTVQTIELVNEPFPYTSADLNFLKSYYSQGYATVLAANQQSQIVVALDDGYQGLDAWTGFMIEPNYHNVAMDTHIYTMWGLLPYAAADDAGSATRRSPSGTTEC